MNTTAAAGVGARGRGHGAGEERSLPWFSRALGRLVQSADRSLHLSRAPCPVSRAPLFMLLLALCFPLAAQDPGADDPAPPEQAYHSIDAMRRGAPLSTEPVSAPMARVENADLRRQRAWPEQPPTIPHSIDGYQLDKNSNRCLICHSRTGTEAFQAPMVSVTHFMDRDGQVLAQISARRYFCNQCHVVQTDAKPLVANIFVDVDQVIAQPANARE